MSSANKNFIKNLKKIISNESIDVFSEMALCFLEKRNFFNNHTKLTIEALKLKNQSNYWNLKGWNLLRNYYKEVYKKYIKSTEYNSFEKLFEIEIHLYTKDWKELDLPTQKLMLNFFKELDANPKLLDIPEDSK